MEDNDVNAGLPGILGSQLDLGSIGDIGKSVNLFRGDVNLPLKLVSLAGRNNLDISVVALYGSNIHTFVNTWNMDAPTDVLGVGWSMSFEKIVVDIKNTGTSYDDNFYIVIGGNTIPLFRTGSDGDAICFQAKNYNFWQVYYYQNQADSASERWEIVKEDGSRYIYGAVQLDGDYAYGVNGSQQWGVKWKNWVGSTVSTAGTQYSVAWNLAQIINIWGDCVYFDYDNNDIPVGENDLTQYTRSSRIRKIIDVYGQTVNFVYAPKDEDFEIQRPIMSPRDITAFQFQYEEKFLDKIVVENENKELLFTVQFQYDFYNVSNKQDDYYYKKRYLKSVRTVNGNGEPFPGVAFDYYIDYTSDINPGALKSITFPHGGIATYKYESGKLTNTSTCREVKSPGTDFTPNVWHGSDYVVITWYSSVRKKVLISVYSWGGNWREWKYDELNELNIENFSVLNAQGFFVVYFKDLNLGWYRLLLFKQNEYRFGEWSANEVKLGNEYTSVTIAMGEDFIAAYSPNSAKIAIWQWDGLNKQWAETWATSKQFGYMSLAANTNFLIAAGYNEHAQQIFVQLYYADANRKWKTGGSTTISGEINLDYTNFNSLWSIGTSFAVAAYITSVDEINLYYNLLVFGWKTDFSFTNVVKHSYYQDRNLSNALNTTIVNNSLIGSGQRVARFNGERWIDKEMVVPRSPNEYQYAYGDDMVILTKKNGNIQEVSSALYDPYQSRWIDGDMKGTVSGDHMSTPAIAGDYCVAANNIYFRDQTRKWNKIFALPQNVDPSSVQNRAPGYLLYQMKNEPNNTYLLFFKDGALIGKTKLEGKNIHVSGGAGQVLAGAFAFVTYSGVDFAKTPTLNIYQVVNQSIDDEGQVDYSVASVSIFNGYSQIDTNYKYNRETATYDPKGLVSQFSQAGIWYQEDNGAFSHSDHVYFNGLDPQILDVIYPDTDDFTNVRDYFSCFNGQIYQSSSYNADGRKVVDTINYLYAFDKNGEGEPLYGVYGRSKKKIDTTQLYLFDADVSLMEDLDNELFSTAVKDVFHTYGFYFSGDVSIEVPYASKNIWVIADGESGKEYTICQENGKLAVYGALVKITEYGYNGKGQLAKTSTYNFNSEGREEKLSVEKQYGWEVYPRLLDINLLTPEVQSKTWNETQNVTTGISVLTLRNWNQGADGDKWGADKSYKWDGTRGTENFDYQACSGNGEPASGWVKTAQIVAMNEYGAEIEKTDIDNIHSSTLFDVANRFTVATFKNASITSGEVSYYGFEEYENPQGWTVFPQTEPMEKYIGEGDSYTGTRRLFLPGQSLIKVGLTNCLTIKRNNGKYVLSCWIKTAKEFAGEGAGWEITVGVSGKIVCIPILSTRETWQYFYHVIDPVALGESDVCQITMSVYNLQDNNYLLIDNIGFAPMAGNFEAAVYETPYRLNTGVIGMWGETSRKAYDSFQRLAVIAGNDNKPQVLSVGGLWRQYTETFDPADPNSAAKITVRTGGSFEEFRHGNQWQDNWQASADWEVVRGKLVYSGVTAGSLVLKNTVDQKNYGARFNMSLGEIIDKPIGVKIGDCLIIQWDKGQWELYNCIEEKVVDSLAQPEMNAKDWLVIAGEHGVLFFADGRQVLKYMFPTTVWGQFQLFTANKIAIEYITVFIDPITSITYNDNSSKPIQVQNLDDCSILVQEFCADHLGRDAITTKVARFDKALFGYRQNFVRSIDWISGLMTGEIADCYPGDEGYPYSRIRYEKSTLARVVEMGGPGKLFAINLEVPEQDRHTVFARYCANVKNKLLNELPVGEYTITSEIDRDKNSSALLTDKLGNKIATIQGSQQDGDANFAMSRNCYNMYGNIAATKQPNYFQENIPQHERFQLENEYDFFGRTIRASTPDMSQSTVSIFDTAGRVRFMQDANGAEKGYIIYWLYDRLGRNTEKGICYSPWDESKFKRHIDDKTWRPDLAFWDKKYEYDGDGSDPNLVGRLWKVLSCGDESLWGKSEEVFVYNIDGQMIRKTVRVFDYDGGAEHTSSYEYDNIGNNIRLTYNEEDTTPFVVTYNFNNQGQLYEINGRDGALVRYGYKADGSIQSEIFNPGKSSELIRTYDYNSAGWLVNLQDRLFTETLDYTDNGYLGVGYYSGKIARIAHRFNGIQTPGEFMTSYSYQYAYDKLDRLQSAVNEKDSAWSMGGDSPLTYDTNCNACHWSKGNVEEEYVYYPGTNKIQSASANTQDIYNYNSNGDIIFAQPRGITNIKYGKASGVALSMQGSDGNPANDVSFAYDGGNRRILKKDKDSCRLYILSTNGDSLMEKVKGPDGEERVIFNVYGVTGIFAVQKVDKVYNLIKDHLLSTRVVFDGTDICAAYNYTPFGEFMGGVMELPGCDRITQYLYTSQELDDETGLYNYKARFYDPYLGRFYSIDPAGQFPGAYVYAGNDPISFIDPSGQTSVGSIFAIMGGIAAFLGGIALAAFTSGGSLVALGAIGGGMLAGGGGASVVYGATHTEDFRAAEWGAMVGLGATFGAISGGVSLIGGGLLMAGGYGVATNTVLGGVESFVSNGITNVMNGQGFLVNAGPTVGIGVAFGFAITGLGTVAVRTLQNVKTNVKIGLEDVGEVCDGHGAFHPENGMRKLGRGEKVIFYGPHEKSLDYKKARGIPFGYMDVVETKEAGDWVYNYTLSPPGKNTPWPYTTQVTRDTRMDTIFKCQNRGVIKWSACRDVIRYRWTLYTALTNAGSQAYSELT
ncbi:RHS repeat-associated core domain-containing protein [Pelosinus sp. sgz500959]|uniref:RHS repeat-associated core domain-containing protein n=1 Tax=Pelosinus sp. sgz500959 TaxID=3242472 RepID=UPI00366B2BB2